MEKIYMEKKQKKKYHLDGTTILSFVVAIFAIVSLVAAGFNQISYALPAVQEPLPDQFTTKTFDSGTDMLIGDSYSKNVDMHYAIVGGQNIPVFCLQRDVDFADGKQYQKSQETLNDTGLLYLMANLYPNAEMSPEYPISNSEKNTNHQVETWITQTAIWYYLASIGAEGNNVDAQDLQFIKNNHSIGFTRSSMDKSGNIGYPNDDHTLYDSYKVNGKSINQLITEAIAKKDQPATTITVNADKEYSLSEDKNYYFSSEINVQGNVSDASLATYKGFSVKLNNAPDGTIITDGEGQQIKDTENMAVGTKFFVRVPADKVNEATRISITVNGKFEGYGGNKYVTTDNKQVITTVKVVPNEVSAGYEFEIAPAPDTGMNTAQTIYFIGLIVLLCGLGIIYANTRKTEVKQ